jgi:hypothetical protein
MKTKREKVSNRSYLAKVGQASKKGRQAGYIDEPPLTANIFAAATNRTNTQNKTGRIGH